MRSIVIAALVFGGFAQAKAPKAGPKPVRVEKKDCAKKTLGVIVPGSCERRAVPVTAKVCKASKIGDQVHLGPFHASGQHRAIEVLGPTTSVTGRLIIFDKVSGFIQLVDHCALNCNAKISKKDAQALKMEEGVELTGTFDWSKTCDVRDAKARPVVLRPAP